MASYFVATDADDLLLLPQRDRDAPDLEAIAAQAERDVIRYYTDEQPDLTYSMREGESQVGTVWDSDLGLYVFLNGYEVDSADADVNANLKQALKETIADVIAWRLKRATQDPAVMSESSQSGSSKSFDVQLLTSTFPPNWNWRLAPYDIRTPFYGA